MTNFSKINRTLPLLAVLAAVAVVVMDRDLPASPVPASAEAVSAYAPSLMLRSEVLSERDWMAAPTDVEVMGPDLVIADNFADRPLSVIRRSTGAMVQSFGRMGRGPREFETAWSVDVIDQAGRFMVHDVTLQRVTWVDMDRDFQDGEWVADRSVKLNANALLLDLGWSPDGLKGLGTFQEGRLGHLASDGRLLRTTGPTPLEGEEVPAHIRQQAYQSKLKPNPSRTRWVVATRHADRLEIFDAAGNLLAQGDRPVGFEPTYSAEGGEAGQARMTSDEDLRFGYIDVTTTEDRIYGLFSGRTRAEGRANYGTRVHVFDWDGNLLDVMELDSPIIAVAAAPEGDVLYGIRHEPMPAIVRYPLRRARGE